MKRQLSSLSGASAKLEETACVFHSLSSFVVSNNADTESQGQTQHTAMTSGNASEALSPWSLATPTTDLASYTDTFTSFLESQDHAMVDLDAVDVGELFGCLEPEKLDARGRKRTFDAAFDWFSWDSYYLRNDSGTQ